jgi:hypothetical protein
MFRTGLEFLDWVLIVASLSLDVLDKNPYKTTTYEVYGCASFLTEF